MIRKIREQFSISISIPLPFSSFLPFTFLSRCFEISLEAKQIKHLNLRAGFMGMEYLFMERETGGGDAYKYVNVQICWLRILCI